MSPRAFLPFVIAASAACGGDGATKTPDAPPVTPSFAVVDPCPGAEAATFTTLATAFSQPSATITMGQVVKFVSTATHPVGAIAPTDATLAVSEGQTKCFRFTMPGTFRFKCTVHGYAGMLTVN